MVPLFCNLETTIVQLAQKCETKSLDKSEQEASLKYKNDDDDNTNNYICYMLIVTTSNQPYGASGHVLIATVCTVNAISAEMG